MDRRAVLLAGSAAAFAGAMAFGRKPAFAAPARYAVMMSSAAWQAHLSPAAYQVLREQSTEMPFTSPLLNEHRKGVFACDGCNQSLFSSTTKFDSGTGWPSFYAPLAHAVSTSNDNSMIEERTEVHCSRCGGHLGHVFNDGPRPTGLRYCMNGVAMQFHTA